MTSGRQALRYGLRTPVAVCGLAALLDGVPIRVCVATGKVERLAWAAKAERPFIGQR
jgi:hypothetical protein